MNDDGRSSGRSPPTKFQTKNAKGRSCPLGPRCVENNATGRSCPPRCVNTLLIALFDVAVGSCSAVAIIGSCSCSCCGHRRLSSSSAVAGAAVVVVVTCCGRCWQLQLLRSSSFVVVIAGSCRCSCCGRRSLSSSPAAAGATVVAVVCVIVAGSCRCSCCYCRRRRQLQVQPLLPEWA